MTPVTFYLVYPMDSNGECKLVAHYAGLAGNLIGNGRSIGIRNLYTKNLTATRLEWLELLFPDVMMGYNPLC
jgi:hypothetical protein